MTDSTPDDADSTGTTHYSPFGREVRAREAHLAALPGKKPAERFDSLNRTSQVFSGNSVELVQHLSRFVGTMRHVRQLPDDFDVEANRLPHNYLASLATLRDIQRSIHHQLWPEKYAPHNEKDERTKWEVKIWAPQVTKHFGDDPIRFLVYLRNFSMHYAIPPVTLTTRWHGVSGRPMQWTNEVALDRNELLKYSRWSGAARRYIATHDGDIEFLPVVSTYSTRVREFFGWFWDKVMHAEVDESSQITIRILISEYYGKKCEYKHWRKVEGTWGHFGRAGRSVQRPKLATARRDRAEYGTGGWRMITLDDNGEWVVGESDPDWPPLPPGSR